MEKNYKRKLESQSTDNISQQIKKRASMMHISNLKNAISLWPRLDALDKRFLSDAHMIMAIRTEKCNIYKDVFIIVKKDRNVYSYSYGGAEQKCIMCIRKNVLPFFETMNIRDNSGNPNIIENLCNKNIKTFIQQYTHGLYVLTNQGEVYSWGDNKDYSLGHNESKVLFNPMLVTSLKDENIVDIACGQKHALALSSDGKVYTWGMRTNNFTIETPKQVKSELENKKVVCIACGMLYSIVVTDTGEVYSWGSLFTDDTSKQQLSNIRRIPFSATIVKVACGSEHVLALTDQGDLYVWGNNNHGQLGTGNKTNIHDPILLNTSEMGKLSDIAALSMKHISVAVNENRCFYVWGQYVNCEILTPRFFPHHMNMYDVFASENVMYEPLILSADDHEGLNVMRCLKDAFDDPSTSDFKVQVEGRDIHVHKAVLKICSSQTMFRTMFQHDEIENIENVLKLDMFSYNVYKAYLKYLYTNVIDIPSGESLELLKLADMYDDMNLKTDCIRIIQKIVTVSNVALFYSKAIEYNEKRLEVFCSSFILRNMTKMILTKSFMKLNNKTKNMFLIKAAKAGVFKT